MPGEKLFRYRPSCSANGCAAVAHYKMAAAWSDGTSRELKNYGLACDTHRNSLLERARRTIAVFDCQTERPLAPSSCMSCWPDAAIRNWYLSGIFPAVIRR